MSPASAIRSRQSRVTAAAVSRTPSARAAEGGARAALKRHGETLLGSVGCYRLEDDGAQLFEAIDGDYFTILGLPLMGLLGVLRERGALAT